MKRYIVLSAFFVSFLQAQTESGDWPVYGHDPGGSKYSPLAQINRKNVQTLKVAWTYHTGDMYKPADGGRQSALETTPIFVDGKLFLSTPFGRIIALEPDSGKEIWSFDPKIDVRAGYGDFANRGVATWLDGKSNRRRIFIATIDARLIAVDAVSGVPCKDFGRAGEIDLRAGLRNPPAYKSEYEETSPPAVIGDLVIVGSAVADNGRVDAASGEVRAFDARTGSLRWTFDTLLDHGPKNTGAANAWSVISTDPERGLVFIPVGSASPDYYGGLRPGSNLYANSVVAVRADTGKPVWSFQTVHHDLWDYDVASQPTLFVARKNGKDVRAIAVGSKTGNLFLLDRDTGKPLFPVSEKPVPASDVPGEEASPTQPVPSAPAPLVPQRLTADDAWGASEEDRKFCRERIGALRSEGIFTPPSIRGSLIFPGNIGGMAWGGAAFDAAHGLLVIPTNRLAAVIHLIPRDKFAEAQKNGHGEEFASQRGTPYGMSREFLRGPHGMPCNAPPWGALTAVDVASGAKKWEVPLGSMFGFDPKFGSVSLGGPIVTAGGLVFIGATLDSYLRAFDVETGAELWKGELPTSARATPMTYRGKSGKQYVIIAAGGHDVPPIKQDDAIVAFALPQ